GQKLLALLFAELAEKVVQPLPGLLEFDDRLVLVLGGPLRIGCLQPFDRPLQFATGLPAFVATGGLLAIGRLSVAGAIAAGRGVSVAGRGGCFPAGFWFSGTVLPRVAIRRFAASRVLAVGFRLRFRGVARDAVAELLGGVGISAFR